jgi:hypothetical protein
VGAGSNGPSSGCVSVTVAGQGLGSRGYSGAARVGRGSASEGDMTGGTACEASRWLSSSSAVCKVGGGVGGGARRGPASSTGQGQGLPVVVSAGLQCGSLTQAWSYDAAEVSAVGAGSNGPSSGCVSVTVAGQGLGSRGYSGAARVGRGSASEGDMTGGTACEASRWLSSSSAVCKVGGGVGGGARRGPASIQGQGHGCRRCECGAAVRQPDAGLELRRCGGERCGGREQRAVVGLRVCDCCGARAGQPGLQRGCARGPRVCERGRHDGRDGVRGVSMVVVEQRCLQGGRGRRGRGQARASAHTGAGQGLPVVVSAGLQCGSLTQAWSYDAAEVSAVGAGSNGPSSGCVSVTVAGQGLGSRGYSGAARVGRGSASEGDMTGGTACEASRWLSSSSAVCKVGGGVGGGARRGPASIQGQGLPVVVSAGLQCGSLTQAWSYDAAEVSAVGAGSNGPSSGCVSVTVAGQGLGSRGYSGAARVGRGSASEGDMTGGTACEASRWLSSSSAVCKVGGGVGGGARRGPAQHRAGAGAARRCECGAAVRQPDAGLELRRCGGERCGGREQRAVVGLRVCDCCGARAGQPGLQRGCARGPRVCERGRHDGRDGVRGVSMVVVEQRCLQGGRGRRGRGQARASAA